MSFEQEKEESNATTKLTYLLIGGGIGAILALLFAPKSGQELREDIADVTKKGIDKSREAAAQLQERAGDYYEVTRDRAQDFYETAQDRASELYVSAQDKAEELAAKAKGAASRGANPISAAIDAGKKAYYEEKRKTEATSITDGRASYPVEEKLLEIADETTDDKKAN